MFEKILIANRGEISCRIAATASRLGIRTVAVYSDADRNAKHVAVCDEAIQIGGASAAESYLCVDRIVRAARTTGAQAIHPGYGFLAENEAFALACAEAELTFIGPPPSAIRVMGNKSAAKELVTKAGVPIVPGYHGKSQKPANLQRRAEALGYPVLLKASAGGGGKGMRVVDTPEDFAAALTSCRREAKNSFGDDALFIEKYLTHPRHIEIQVFADAHGNYVHLFERDCSVQRRHQKVIEEAPAPGLTETLRRSMGETAVSAARAVGYVGAGTVEFLVDQDAHFYFMEMNTRLQVEHPVTELITGQDLVEWQLRVAAGLPLPLLQDQLLFRGHAIEARIYAENPDNHFLPSIGTLRVLRLPPAIEFAVPPSPEPGGVRVDSGVREGDVITPYYDPMIAKLIAWGNDRTNALARLRQALSDLIALGLHTNRAFLWRLVSSSDFAAAKCDTGFIDRSLSRLLTSPIRFPFVALATAALLQREEKNARVENADPYSPWTRTSGWRLNGEYSRSVHWRTANQRVETNLTYARKGYLLKACGQSALISIIERQDNEFALLADTDRIAGHVYMHGNYFAVVAAGEQIGLHWVDPMGGGLHAEHEEGSLSAPMPGKIVAVLVKNGQAVSKGTPLITMEAMKMEHTIAAVADGVVDEVLFNVGDQVTEGTQLLRFSPNNS
jgi:3-methylcrotonyl-CoA carboxylase alpha subunit